MPACHDVMQMFSSCYQDTGALVVLGLIVAAAGLAALIEFVQYAARKIAKFFDR